MTRTVKILLILSLILGACALERIAKQHGLRTDHESQPQNKISPKHQINIVSNLVETNDEFWSAPKEDVRGEGWTFDLFTAPTITQKDGQYRASLPWITATVEQEVKFELIALEPKLYPIQFLGFIELPKKDGGQIKSFMIRDNDQQQTLQAKLGDTITTHKIEIKNFEERGPEGLVTGYPKLYVTDHEFQREEILTPKEKYYEHLFHLVIKTNDDQPEISLSHIGENFSIGEATYSVLSADMDKKIVLLEQKLGKFSKQIEITEPNLRDTSKP